MVRMQVNKQLGQEPSPCVMPWTEEIGNIHLDYADKSDDFPLGLVNQTASAHARLQPSPYKVLRHHVH